MKKKVVWIICILIFFVSNETAAQIFIKAAHTFFWWEKKNDAWFSASDYFLQENIPQGHIQAGSDLSLDIVFRFHENFSFSIGGEYISRPFDGTKIEFTYPSSSEIQGTAAYTPIMNTQLYVIPVSLIFSKHLTAALYLKVIGGGAYYFGKLNCDGDAFELPDQRRSGINWPYISFLYKSKIKNAGFHIGTGLDLGLSEKSFFFVEFLYRLIQFDDINTYSIYEATPLDPDPSEETVKYGEKTTFIYLYKMGGLEAMGDMDYRITKLDMSGLAIRIGLRFGF